MFDDQIIQNIMDAWESDQNHPHRGREKKIKLDKKVLKSLVETAFQASMAREEEQNLKFNLVLYSRNEYNNQPAHGCRQNALIFEKTQPLNEEKIRKLTPALATENSGLAVEVSEDGKLKVWGLVYWGNLRNRFNQIAVGIEGYMTSRPDALMVTAMGIGNLIISRGIIQIGRLMRGVFESASPTPFISKALGGYLIEAIKNGELYRNYNNAYWFEFGESLMYLLQRVSLKSHGGAIVLIREDGLDEAKKQYEDKYNLSGSLQISEAVRQRLDYDTQMNDVIKENPGLTTAYMLFNVKVGQSCLERLDMLAQLACVDGALILSYKLEVLTFGAKLKAEPWGGKVLRMHDNDYDGSFDTSMYGTRHSSMINFIGACCSKAIGFVISQDGPVRGFVKSDSQTILCWPDCRISMFTD